MMARRRRTAEQPGFDFGAGEDPFEEPAPRLSPPPPPEVGFPGSQPVQANGNGRAPADTRAALDADPFADEPAAASEGAPGAEPHAEAKAAPTAGGTAELRQPSAATEGNGTGPPAAPAGAAPAARGGETVADSDILGEAAVRAGLGASLRDLLDLKQWEGLADPGLLFQALGHQARRAVEWQRALREPFRQMLRERVRAFANAPADAGLHAVTEADLLTVARGFLYNGLSEAVAGHFVMHETAPLALGLAAVSVVGYSGRHDQYHHRLLRRELPIAMEDPMAAAEELLERRNRDRRAGGRGRFEQLSDLARRGIVSFMERRVMAEACAGKWRLGHGHPTPLELLTGMGSMELLDLSLPLLRRLLLEDTRWLFVSRRSFDRALDPLLEHLDPLEFVILKRLGPDLEDQVATGRYLPRHRARVDSFLAEVGPKLVLGAFRVGPMSPVRTFVAHEDRAYQAALIGMADAVTTQPNGMPALVLLARADSEAAVGGPEFERAVHQAYLEAGAEEQFYRGEVS